MVSGYGVDNVCLFSELFGKVGAELHVGALLLLIHSLTYIVQQPRALCKRYVQPKLGSHKPRKLSNLYGMLIHVLTVARSVFKSTY